MTSVVTSTTCARSSDSGLLDSDAAVTTSKRPTRNRHRKIRPQEVAGFITKLTEEPRLNSLLADRIITPEDLDKIRELYRIENGWVGRVHLNSGFCSRLKLYQHWASCLRRPLMDLFVSPPDFTLFRGLNPSVMLDERWVP